MICPVCGGPAARRESIVDRGERPAFTTDRGLITDSRVSRDHIRRRRVCASCGARFTTHETPVVDEEPPTVAGLIAAASAALAVAARLEAERNLSERSA